MAPAAGGAGSSSGAPRETLLHSPGEGVAAGPRPTGSARLCRARGSQCLSALHGRGSQTGLRASILQHAPCSSWFRCRPHQRQEASCHGCGPDAVTPAMSELPGDRGGCCACTSGTRSLGSRRL